jgi:CDP-diacylglycerol---serine O-phosphatidyltransferase
MAIESNKDEAGRLKIYFLPNLMTAGNLFCGFVALTKIVEADIANPLFNNVIRHALFFILLACIFDLLDGRVARMGGAESPFGREFDSLADLISFGAAPAFLVHRIVLRDVFADRPEVGWFIASVYLICGALRLARFNCLATMPGGGGSKDFMGFPIPAAAGLVASLTLFLMWLDDKGFATGNWRYALPVILIFLSMMMVSEVKYPSFKKLDLHATKPFTKIVLLSIFLGLILILRNLILPVVLPLIFTAYLGYGFIRPRISREMRKEIEDTDDDDEDENQVIDPPSIVRERPRNN